LLHLLAESFEALQRLLDIRLLGGPADLDLQLVDRRLQRLLAVFDRAFELPANVARYATFSLAQSLSADPDRAVNQPGRPGPRRRPLLCRHASTSAIYAGTEHLTRRIRMGPA
jgi:hypothetical protein